MSRLATDGCGCFPTGRHYPGIAHRMRASSFVGLVEEFDPTAPWVDLPVALLDTETTGREAATERIIEIGIVVGRGGEIISRFNWLIHPERPIPPDSTQIHGITDEDVKDAPHFHQVAAEISAALEGAIPAAYNAPFDRGFLHAEFARAHFHSEKPAPFLRRNVQWLDPLVWARELQKNERSRTLGDVAARLGIKLENAHRASDDAEAALRVLYTLGKDARVPRAYGGFIQEQRRLELAQEDERRRWRSRPPRG